MKLLRRLLCTHRWSQPYVLRGGRSAWFCLGCGKHQHSRVIV